MITVLFFGRVADLVQRRTSEVAASPSGDTLLSLRDRVFAGVEVPATVRMSLNKVVVPGDAPVVDGDEVAFFSVFSGG